jgi:hypothetical protein
MRRLKLFFSSNAARLFTALTAAAAVALSAAAAAFCLGAGLMLSAKASLERPDWNAEALLTPDFRKREWRSRDQSNAEQFALLGKTLASNADVNRDDRRVYLAAGYGLTPAYAFLESVSGFAPGSDFASSMQGGQNVYSQTALDVRCGDVSSFHHTYNGIAYTVYAYGVTVNQWLASSPSFGELPGELRLLSELTWKNEPLMEPGGRYLIVGDYYAQGDYASVELFSDGVALGEGDLEDASRLPSVRVPGGGALTFDTAEALAQTSGLSAETAARWFHIVRNCREITSSVPAVTAEDMNRIPAFYAGTAVLVEGRGLTPADSESGERLCVVSDELARRAALSVGDTLSLAFREARQRTNYEKGISDLHCSPLDGPLAADEFQVVGVYRAASPSDGFYAFSPDTIFVSSGSLPAVEFDWRNQGVGVGTTLLNTFYAPGPQARAFLKSLPPELSGLLLVWDRGAEQGLGALDGLFPVLGSQAVMVFAVSLSLWLAALTLFLHIQRRRLRRVPGEPPAHPARRYFAVCLKWFLAATLPGTLAALAFFRPFEEGVYTDVFRELTRTAYRPASPFPAAGLALAAQLVLFTLVCGAFAIRAAQTNSRNS